MCRIVGIIASPGNIPDHIILKDMLASLEHGGPDDEGVYGNDSVLFGHRRLSIIDLSSAGHQPMSSKDNKITITYNGEIYNYLILKEELISLGHSFYTDTDTEVIVCAYKAWGISMLERLEGMFALAIHDLEKKKVVLARDHAGIKPLYFYKNQHQFVFASEVKAFRSIEGHAENADWKILFLAFGSLPHPFTTLENVFQLTKGSFLELNLTDFKVEIKPYKKNESSNSSVLPDQTKALKQIRTRVESAVKAHLVADAPLGVFLSGGIDSSLLTLLADKYKSGGVNSLSVNFKEAEFDEAPFQQIVLNKTRQTKHVSYQVDEQLFMEHLNDIWNAMDQPSIDGVNSYFVSLCAKQNGLKAVLSGLGADEYFGGYKSFSRVFLIPGLRLVPFKNFCSKFILRNKAAMQRLAYLALPGAIGDYLFLRGIHTPGGIAALLKISEKRVWAVLKKLNAKVPKGLSRRQYATFLETEFYMSNQLLKDTDCMSMWHSVEVRVPFLDQQLIRQVQQIDPNIRYKKDSPKYLLTASFHDLLPNEIVFRKKQGFTFPFKVWLINQSHFFKLLLPSNNKECDRIYHHFISGKVHWSKFWSLLVLQQFDERERNVQL